MFLLKGLRDMAASRRKWAHRCWAIGSLSILCGLGGCTTSHVLYVGQYSSVLVGAIDVGSVLMIVGGGLAIAIGPISWYWFRRST